MPADSNGYGEKATLFSFRGQLFGSKGPRRFWNLGKVWLGLRQGDKAFRRAPGGWMGGCPGCPSAGQR